MKQKFQRVNPGKEGGASLVEYALLVALIAIVAVVSLKVFGNTLSTQYSTLAHETFNQ